MTSSSAMAERPRDRRMLEGANHFECKFQTERWGTLPTNHCWCQRTRVDCPFTWYQNLRSALFGFVTKHACDRQTDSITTPKTALAQVRRTAKISWELIA